MRCVLFSSTKFGAQCLKALADLKEFEICGLVTTAKQIKISYSELPVQIVTHFDFMELEYLQSVPVYSENEMFNSAACQGWLQTLKPDLLLVLGWYYMVPSVIRNIAPLGAIAIHASLLPKYRGGAPLVWAIMNGEQQVGATLFYLSDGVDNGDIIGQVKVEVEEEDSIATVYEKITICSIDLLQSYIPKIASGTAPRKTQDESEAVYYSQRSLDDGRIQWSSPARTIHDFVRAQTSPYPGAFTQLNGQKVTIWQSSIKPLLGKGFLDRYPAGSIVLGPEIGKELYVVCGDGNLLSITTLGCKGSHETPAEFMRKNPLVSGTIFA